MSSSMRRRSGDITDFAVPMMHSCQSRGGLPQLQHWQFHGLSKNHRRFHNPPLLALPYRASGLVLGSRSDCRVSRKQTAAASANTHTHVRRQPARVRFCSAASPLRFFDLPPPDAAFLAASPFSLVRWVRDEANAGRMRDNVAAPHADLPSTRHRHTTILLQGACALRRTIPRDA